MVSPSQAVNRFALKLPETTVKILHVPYIYYPDPCGGTEVYVASLCQFLAEAGDENVIAAPTSGQAASYDHAGIKVRRFAIHPALTQDMMYGEGDPVAAAGFATVLDEEQPDLVHFHAFTPAVSVLCLRETQRRGIPAVTTYHTPTNSCLRGDLMLWGEAPCDGAVYANRCAACLMNAHGVPKFPAKIAAAASHLTRPLASLPGLPNAAKLVLNSKGLVLKRRNAMHEWWAGMKRVIALCDWTQRLLELNGVPSEKLAMVRHGLPYPNPSAHSSMPASKSLKLVFFGRFDRTKGVDLVIEALRLSPELPVTLDIFAILPPDDQAANTLMRLVKDDARITLRPTVPAAQVESTMREYDALLIPSRWLETGPLVLLEAFAAGLPVIGSQLGGIAERVNHEVDGLLVSETTPAAWLDAFQRLVDEPMLMDRLRKGVKPPITMREVAANLRTLYAGAVAPGL